jgi:hypothetical protein
MPVGGVHWARPKALTFYTTCALVAFCSRTSLSAQCSLQIGATAALRPMSWSPDGRRLVGLAAHPDVSTPGAAVYDSGHQPFTLFPVSATLLGESDVAARQ